MSQVAENPQAIAPIRSSRSVLARRLAIVACAIGLSAISGLCTFMALRHEPTGTLVVDAEIQDLGRLAQGQSRRGEFVIYNDALSPIRIERVIPSCDCTVAELDAQALEPGRSTRLRAEYHAKAARGRTSTSLMLLYRIDGTKGVLTKHLQFVADVEPDYGVEPSRLTFDRNQAATRAIQFSPGVTPKLTILWAQTTHPAFSTMVVPPADDRGDWVVHVIFDPSVLTESMIVAPVELVVKTTSPNEPTHRLALELGAEPSPAQEPAP